MATSAPDSAPVYYPPAPTGLRRPAIIAAVLTVIVAIIAVFLGLSLIHISEPTRPY